jgi:hypothetical protein
VEDLRRISLGRFVLALLVAMLSAGFLFVFWLYVLNAFFGFARTTSPEGTQLLTTLAMQVAPAALILAGTFLPVFLAFAFGPTLVASLIVRMLKLRSAPSLAGLGALTGLAGLALFQIVDVAVLGAATPILSFQDSGVPALLAGACGGLVAWSIAFGGTKPT